MVKGSPVRPHNPKTEEPVAVVRRVLVAVGDPQVPRVARDGAPPEDANGTRWRATRIFLITTSILAIPVPDPLPDVAAHVMEAPRVRVLLLHRVGRVL